MRRHRRHSIYNSWRHVGATVLFLLIPFLFLLGFARFAEIAVSVLFADVSLSFLRLTISYVIAAVFAWIFAVSFYRGARATVALPFFDVLQSFPTFAALPIAVYLWGSSDVTVIFFLVLTIIWPIFFTLISSLKLIRKDWQEAVQISGLSGVGYFRKFLWPLTKPALITGSIIGLGEGWEALVATEIIAKTPVGLGRFFENYSQDPSLTAFGILGLLVLIFCINKLLWLPLLETSHALMEE